MPIIHDEEFRTWESTVRQGQRGDPVWRFHAYRVALFMLDRVGRDAVVLKRQCALPFQTDQLLRAVASIWREHRGRSGPTVGGGAFAVLWNRTWLASRIRGLVSGSRGRSPRRGRRPAIRTADGTSQAPHRRPEMARIQTETHAPDVTGSPSRTPAPIPTTPTHPHPSDFDSLSVLPSSTDDRCPPLGVEARAAHEQTVDVRSGEERRGIPAIDAAAIENRHRFLALVGE